jgi:hypothetical protein
VQLGNDGGGTGSGAVGSDAGFSSGGTDAAVDGNLVVDASVPMDGSKSDTNPPLDSASVDAAALPDATTCVGSPPAATATYLTDPGATQTATTKGYVLHKELNAYNNYGATDCKADILYSGQVGVWTFPVPSGNILSATVVVSVTANDPEDHDAGPYPASAYSFRLWSSGCEYVSAHQLSHGQPFNACFTNWTQLSYPATVTPGATYVVTMDNASQLPTTEWIGVDWVELRVTTQ